MEDTGETGMSVASAAGSVTSGVPTSTPAAEPTALDLSDENTLIRIKGSEKPVKFGEHVRGFQSQFTKASQRAAQLEKTLAERESRIQQYEQERQAAAQRQSQGGQSDVFEALRQLPYLSGSDAVEVVQGIGEQIRQRDMVLLGALKQMQTLQQTVQGLSQHSTGQAFNGKITHWLQQGGYPPEAADLAKEIYLAYEGDDLDSEFPGIFDQRWQQIEKLVEARRQAKVTANRKQPFLPGKGGQTHPSKPLELKPNLSSRDMADQLYEMLQNGTETGT